MRTTRRLHAAALLALFTALTLLWPGPALAEIEDITIGVDGMT